MNERARVRFPELKIMFYRYDSGNTKFNISVRFGAMKNCAFLGELIKFEIQNQFEKIGGIYIFYFRLENQRQTDD